MNGRNKSYIAARTIVFAACLLTLNTHLRGEEPFPKEDCGIVAEAYLSEGDMLLFGGKSEDARKIYEFILKDDPDSYEALWRLSRYYLSSGMAAEKVSDKKKKWEEAEKCGRQAVAINPGGTEGHLHLAVAIGNLALYSPAADKVRRVWEIKNEAEKAMELDPDYEKAYLTLGAWHRNVATASLLEKKLAKIFFGELPQASLEESLELLLKSISLGGHDVRNYYELAMTYDAMGDYKSAKRQYQNALSASLLYPEDARIKTKIKKTLKNSRYN